MKEFNKLIRTGGGHGNSLEEIIRGYSMMTNDNSDSYVLSIVDEREKDEPTSTRNQADMSILISNLNLVRRCLRRSNIGCDGTFSVVSFNPTKGVTYELNTMVEKGIGMGLVFPVYRQISSRKTVAKRMNMFVEFLKVLRTEGIQDQLTPSVHENLSFCTDFKTTYAMLLEENLLKFLSKRKMADYEWSYMNMCWFGCDFHAKPAILELINISEEQRLYGWVVRTRRVTNIQQRWQAMTETTDLEGKFASFSLWLQETTWQMFCGSNLFTKKTCGDRTYRK